MGNKETIRTEFGVNALAYKDSKVHAKGASLQRLVTCVGPDPEWEALDVATGAGHTAFAFAPCVKHVVATDMTAEMLELTCEGAEARQLANISVEYAEAENLPYPNQRFDLVTCRIAPHHFSDIQVFLKEVQRVLKPGGILGLVDNVVPEGNAGAYINAFEKLRDLSHAKCLSLQQWQSAITAAGLEIQVVEVLRKEMSFKFWAQRHGPDMKAYLLSMLEMASGEAAEFLQAKKLATAPRFYLMEGLIVAQKILRGPGSG